MSTFSLLIVDDHPVVLSGLRLALDRDARYALIGEAQDGPGACAAIERLMPDLIVTDLVMGTSDGTGLIEDYLAIAPHARILVYSSQEERVWAPRTIRAGARGFISKAEPLDRIGEGLEAIISGDIFVSAAVRHAMMHDFARGRAGGDEPVHLSSREMQVLRLLGTGPTLQSLSQQLGVSVKTVGTYRERLKIKLGLENVRMLERFAVDYAAGRATLA